jgi:sigma-B regulation protein RsbU (phosphoserine phosphatase)
MRTDEPVPCELDTDGLILGVKNDVFFEEKTVRLTIGDVLVFYTDGLTEASNNEGIMFGISGLHNHLVTCLHLSAEEIIDSFYARVHAFTGSQNLEDDISFVVVKIL